MSTVAVSTVAVSTVAVSSLAARRHRSVPAVAPGRERRRVSASGVPALPACPAQGVRLTRRGRAVVALLVLGLLAALVAVVTAPTTASAPPRGDDSLPVAERVTVHAGDTLWEIALRTAPQADPRVTVARIKTMNGLGSSAIAAGSVLLVPAGANS